MLRFDNDLKWRNRDETVDQPMIISSIKLKRTLLTLAIEPSCLT